MLRHWRKTTTLCHYFLFFLPGLCDTLLKSIPAKLSAKYAARVPSRWIHSVSRRKKIYAKVSTSKKLPLFIFASEFQDLDAEQDSACLSGEEAGWGWVRMAGWFIPDIRLMFGGVTSALRLNGIPPSPPTQLSKPAEVVMVWGAKGDNSWAEITPEQRVFCLASSQEKPSKCTIPPRLLSVPSVSLEFF